MKSNRYEIDMTNGPLMGKMIRFFVPLMISSILQLLFNAVDLVVVGRFAGSDSLAAVGATSALIHMLSNLFIGISVGANVTAARNYARGNIDEMQETVHTSITFALLTGVTAAVAGIALCRPLLQLMGTPDNVIDRSVLYMSIYYAGMPFFMVYNFGAAILRAVGDTRRPLIFLVIAGILNAGLNVFLIVVFQLGVAGVAIATIFSQMVSCVLVLGCLCRAKNTMYHLKFRQLHINGRILKGMIQIGLPAGIQSTLMNFSNVLLQSSVNSFGSVAMAGYTAEGNLLGFLFVSANSITQTCMTFTSQNYGAAKPDRMKRVLRCTFLLETIVPMLLGGMFFLFGKQLLGIYTDSAQAIAYGMQILPICMLPYFLYGYTDCIPGALRGMGYSTVPMLLSLVGMAGVRAFWVFCIFPLNRDLTFLFISYPASWIITLIMQGSYLAHVSRKVYGKLEKELAEQTV